VSTPPFPASHLTDAKRHVSRQRRPGRIGQRRRPQDDPDALGHVLISLATRDAGASADDSGGHFGNAYGFWSSIDGVLAPTIPRWVAAAPDPVTNAGGVSSDRHYNTEPNTANLAAPCRYSRCVPFPHVLHASDAQRSDTPGSAIVAKRDIWCSNRHRIHQDRRMHDIPPNPPINVDRQIVTAHLADRLSSPYAPYGRLPTPGPTFSRRIRLFSRCRFGGLAALSEFRLGVHFPRKGCFLYRQSLYDAPSPR